MAKEKITKEKESGRRQAAERLALALSRAGLQRMPARVLAAVLFTDTATLTPGELAEQLNVSPGSVSGALKMLTTVGLIEQVPVPGSRRDHHRMRADAWTTLYSSQNALVQVMQDAAEEGIKATGEDSAAGQRLAEMRDFYAFLFRELPALIDRWHASR